MSTASVFPNAAVRLGPPSRIRRAGAAAFSALRQLLARWTERRKLQPVPDDLLDDVGLPPSHARLAREARRYGYSGEVRDRFMV